MSHAVYAPPAQATAVSPSPTIPTRPAQSRVHGLRRVGRCGSHSVRHCCNWGSIGY